MYAVGGPSSETGALMNSKTLPAGLSINPIVYLKPGNNSKETVPIYFEAVSFYIIPQRGINCSQGGACALPYPSATFRFRAMLSTLHSAFHDSRAESWNR